MRNRLCGVVIALLLGLGAMGLNTYPAPADCSPLVCQGLDAADYQWWMWGCWRPPCEIGS